MADEIKALDIKLVGDLFGSAYVMDFTNPTFADFFRDIGVDIYNDAYLIDNGTSKGKRLRAFMKRGQKAAILKALYGLWEWRVHYIAGKPDPVPDGLARLNELIARLGGKPIAGSAPASSAPPQSVPMGPSDAQLQALEERFLDLHSMIDQRQARGFAFERFLQAWFDAWRLDARGSFRTEAEQIDGSFQHDGNTYLIEAKWHATKTDAATLHAFQGKLEERPLWTRGLFVSFEGFTTQGLAAFTSRRIVLMDGSDIYLALRNRIDLDKIVEAKARHAAEYRQPFARVADLFKA